jgi:hypothetical protein
LNETNLIALLDSKLLQIWIFRGAFYVFIGVLGLNECATSRTAVLIEGGSKRRDGTIIQYTYLVSGAKMIVTGLLYVAMGVLCLQLVYNRLEEDYQERGTKAKEVRRTTKTYGGVSNEDV